MATYDKNPKQQQAPQQQQPQHAKAEANWNDQVDQGYRQASHEEMQAGLNGSNQQFQQQQSFKDSFNTMDNSAENVISAMADMLYKPFNKGSLNERAARVMEMFKEFYAETKAANPATMRVDFIQAPASKVAHPYGGIIIALPMKGPDGKLQVCSHFVIVETSMSIASTMLNYNGVQLQYPNTASSTVSCDTSANVEKLTRQYYAAEATEFTYINGNYTVIPVETSIEDRSVIYRVEEYAISAAYTRLKLFNIDSVEDEGVAFSKAAKAKTVRWTSQVEEKPINQTDVVGNLIRTDFNIKTLMVANQTANQQFQLNQLEFGEVNAYCTPVYAEPNKMMTANGMWVPVTSQHYYNRVVIKDFRTGPDVRMSVGTALMLLATTSALAVNGIWKRAYYPNRHIEESQTDIHDIGALGYEVPMLNPKNHVAANNGQPPQKEMIKTKTAEFTTERFNQLMDAAFHPEILYSIDVPDGHYLLALFLAEAKGNENARSIIRRTLNTMTSGKFNEIFPANEPMFMTTEERVINGYYPNTTLNTLRPLDDVDHLAMLNITSGDTEWIRNWEMFDNNGAAQDLRIVRRNEILQRFAVDKAVVKSYSTRVNILPKFMQALVGALSAAGLYPQINSNLVQADNYTRATASQFTGLAIGPMSIANLYNVQQPQGFGNQQVHGANGYQLNPWC